MDALLSANLAIADTLPTMDSLMASLGETPSIHHANLCYALAMHATKDVPWDKLVQLYPELAPAAIDKELNSEKFIVPGLGDFGDRYYGTE